MPRCWASLPTSVGSMPSTGWPCSLKFDNSVPSLEPISMTRCSGFRPNISQDARGAAGIRVAWRKKNFWVHQKPELNQFTLCAKQQVGRVGRLLHRHLTDHPHLVHRRHVTQKQYWLQAAIATHLA